MDAETCRLLLFNVFRERVFHCPTLANILCCYSQYMVQCVIVTFLQGLRDLGQVLINKNLAFSLNASGAHRASCLALLFGSIVISCETDSPWREGCRPQLLKPSSVLARRVWFDRVRAFLHVLILIDLAVIDSHHDLLLLGLLSMLHIIFLCLIERLAIFSLYAFAPLRLHLQLLHHDLGDFGYFVTGDASCVAKCT